MQYHNLDVPDQKVLEDRHAVMSHLTEHLNIARAGLSRESTATRNLITSENRQVVSRLDPVLDFIQTTVTTQNAEKESLMRLYANDLGFEVGNKAS